MKKLIEQTPSQNIVPSKNKFSNTLPRVSIVSQNSNYVKSINLIPLRRAVSLEGLKENIPLRIEPTISIPKPIWPKVKRLTESFQEKANKIEDDIKSSGFIDKQSYKARRRETDPQVFRTSRAQILRFNPLVNVVTQNEKYVTGITISPKPSRFRNKQNQNISKDTKIQTTYDENNKTSKKYNEERLVNYFGGSHPENYFKNEYPLKSLQPDSLVNEHTLKLMDYSKQSDTIRNEQENKEPITVYSGTDLPQIMYTRGLYATLNRASTLQPKDITKPPKRRNSINDTLFYNRTCAKKRGVNAVKDLWEKSGLKTNGRKLLVDLNGVIEDRESRQNEESENLRMTLSLKSRLAGHSDEGNFMLAGKSDIHLPNDRNLRSNDYLKNNSRKDSTSTNGSKSSSAFFEVINEDFGIDNPTFVYDDEKPSSSGSNKVSTHLNDSEKEKMKEFEQKMNRKLENAPMHRKQWMQRSNGGDDISDRKVTFNRGTLEKRYPGVAIRHESYASMSGRREEEINHAPLPEEGEKRGIWTTTESYHNRYRVSLY